MHDTPEQIAARLTKAQRRAILWLPKDGSEVERVKQPMTAAVASLEMRFSDVCKGRSIRTASGRWSCMAYRLTPLGAAVRAVVAKEDGDG